MGRVHSEQINHGRGCQEWYHISLSEYDTVKELILNRCDYDKMYDSVINRTDNPFVMNAIPTFTEPIEVIYIDLERLIKETKLSDIERKVIKLFFKGYDCKDLTWVFKSSLEYTENILDKICKKIVNTNDYLWSVYIETSGNLKIDSDIKYKRCKKCEKDLRANEENYRVRNDKKGDGFYNSCRKCEK